MDVVIDSTPILNKITRLRTVTYLNGLTLARNISILSF